LRAVRCFVALAGLLSLVGLSRAEVQPSQTRSSGVAAYASGRDFGAETAPSEDLETNLCTEQLLMGDPREGPSWNGWGNGPTNTRFQPRSQGKLTAPDLQRLQLKWAFGYANVSSARPQPTIAGGDCLPLARMATSMR